MQSGSQPPRRSSRQRRQNKLLTFDANYHQHLYNKPKLSKNTLKNTNNAKDARNTLMNAKDGRNTYKAMLEKLNKEELPERLLPHSKERRKGRKKDFSQNKLWEDKKNTLNESYMKVHIDHVKKKKLLQNSLKRMLKEKPSSKNVLYRLKNYQTNYQTSKRALQEYIGEYGAIKYIESSRKGCEGTIW